MATRGIAKHRAEDKLSGPAQRSPRVRLYSVARG